MIFKAVVLQLSNSYYDILLISKSLVMPIPLTLQGFCEMHLPSF